MLTTRRWVRMLATRWCVKMLTTTRWCVRMLTRIIIWWRRRRWWWGCWSFKKRTLGFVKGFLGKEGAAGEKGLVSRLGSAEINASSCHRRAGRGKNYYIYMTHIL